MLKSRSLESTFESLYYVLSGNPNYILPFFNSPIRKGRPFWITVVRTGARRLTLSLPSNSPSHCSVFAVSILHSALSPTRFLPDSGFCVRLSSMAFYFFGLFPSLFRRPLSLCVHSANSMPCTLKFCTTILHLRRPFRSSHCAES